MIIDDRGARQRDDKRRERESRRARRVSNFTKARSGRGERGLGVALKASLATRAACISRARLSPRVAAARRCFAIFPTTTSGERTSKEPMPAPTIGAADPCSHRRGSAIPSSVKGARRKNAILSLSFSLPFPFSWIPRDPRSRV